MDEDQKEPNRTPDATAADAENAAAEVHRNRMKRPWRWVLGAVSIAAVGAGVIFISKRGLRKPEQ